MPHAEARERFEKSRWILRTLLGQILEKDPARLEISEIDGKPFLANVKTPLFSLSRSGDWIAVAIGQVPIGIDIEVLEEDALNTDVTDVLFHPEEKERLARFEGKAHTFAFYEHWTQKEAYAKGVGLGVGLDFSQVIVEPKGGLVRSEKGEPGDAWYTHLIEADTRLIMALAVPVAEPEVDMIYWPDRLS